VKDFGKFSAKTSRADVPEKNNYAKNFDNTYKSMFESQRRLLLEFLNSVEKLQFIINDTGKFIGGQNKFFVSFTFQDAHIIFRIGVNYKERLIYVYKQHIVEQILKINWSNQNIQSYYFVNELQKEISKFIDFLAEKITEFVNSEDFKNKFEKFIESYYRERTIEFIKFLDDIGQPFDGERFLNILNEIKSEEVLKS
jgi:hypothetical protein